MNVSCEPAIVITSSPSSTHGSLRPAPTQRPPEQLPLMHCTANSQVSPASRFESHLELMHTIPSPIADISSDEHCASCEHESPSTTERQRSKTHFKPSLHTRCVIVASSRSASHTSPRSTTGVRGHAGGGCGGGGEAASGGGGGDGGGGW